MPCRAAHIIIKHFAFDVVDFSKPQPTKPRPSPLSGSTHAELAQSPFRYVGVQRS